MLHEYLSFIPGSNTPHLHCCNKCGHVHTSCVHVETFMLSDSLIRTLYVYKCPYMCQKWKVEEGPRYKWDIISVRHVLVCRCAYSYRMPEHEYHNANHCTKAQNHCKKLPLCANCIFVLDNQSYHTVIFPWRYVVSHSVLKAEITQSFIQVFSHSILH